MKNNKTWSVNLNGTIQTENREKWANKREFFLSCLGYAIGIGNVWRFPYLCYRSGGGAFLIPYLFMLFFCGIPLFLMETSLGQFASTGCITVFKMAPLFKGAGYAIVVVNLIVTTYFSTLMVYPLLYLYNCFQWELPWAECDNPWNTDNCLKLGDKKANNDINGTLILQQNLTVNRRTKTPADEFFHNNILQISSSIDETGSIVWPLFVCNLIVWTVMYLCIMKGVKSVGKVVYFTATFPFFILFVLLIRGLTLPGAWEGIYFYIYPQWSQLTDLKVWADAASQIFFSLGPGWGGLINMSSYNKFSNNSKLDSILVPIMNCGTSIFAGFVVFSVLGFMAKETGIPISEVASGGPGLAFITYPEAIALLPWPQLWGVLFFIMLFLLGLDSTFVQIETITSSITDEYPQLRRHKSLLTIFSCAFMMVLAIFLTTNAGIYWLTLFDWYAASITVILICLIEVIMIGWTYGVNNFVYDIEFMIKEKISWFWVVSWKFSAPVILSFLFITTIIYNKKASYQEIEFPQWAIDIGWGSCCLSLICIPVYMGYILLYVEKGDIFERISSALQPRLEWCPAIENDKINWLEGRKEFRRKYTKNRPDETLDPLHEQFIQLCSIDKN